jgi:hypothetical protein
LTNYETTPFEIIRPQSAERISTMCGPAHIDILDRIEKIFDMRIFTMFIERSLVGENRNNRSGSLPFIKNKNIET